MTDEVKLSQAILRIREEASAARAFFHTWKALNEARGDNRLLATMNNYRHIDFFITTMDGCFRLFFLSLGKMFDRRKDTSSLQLLAKMLKEGSHADLAQEIADLLLDHGNLIEKVRLVRNKSVAHNEMASTGNVLGSASISPDQIETLIDTSCGILDTIAERMGFPDRISEGERSEWAVQHLLETLHDCQLPRTKTLGWDQVQQFFKDHGCVIAGHPEITWYRESWDALDKAGLTSTTEFQEFELAQTVLKLRAICLLAMYLGMYQAAGSRSELGGYLEEHPSVSWYLDSLDVFVTDIWELARASGMLETGATSYYEDEETDDGRLHEFAMDFIRDVNKAIFDALVEHFGGNVELFVSLWNSRVAPDDVKPLGTLVDSVRPQDGKLEVWAYAEERMKGWSWM